MDLKVKKMFDYLSKNEKRLKDSVNLIDNFKYLSLTVPDGDIPDDPMVPFIPIESDTSRPKFITINFSVKFDKNYMGSRYDIEYINRVEFYVQPAHDDDDNYFIGLSCYYDSPWTLDYSSPYYFGFYSKDYKHDHFDEFIDDISKAIGSLRDIGCEYELRWLRARQKTRAKELRNKA